MNNARYTVTTDIRKKNTFLGISVIIFISLIAYLMLLTVIFSVVNHYVFQFYLVVPVVWFINYKHNNKSLLDHLKVSLDYFVFSQQLFDNEKDIKEFFRTNQFELNTDGSLERKDKVIYYFNLPSYNVPLKTETELSELIEKQAKLLSSLPIESELFSYDLPVDLKRNIKSLGKKLSNEVNPQQRQALENLINDLMQQDESVELTNKCFCIIIKLTKQQIKNGTLPIIKEQLNSYGLYQMNALKVVEMLKTTLAKDYSTGTDSVEKLEDILPSQIKFLPSHGIANEETYFKTILIRKYPNELQGGALSKLSNYRGVNIKIHYSKLEGNVYQLLNQSGNVASYKAQSGKTADRLEAEQAKEKQKHLFSKLQDENRIFLKVTVLVHISASSLADLKHLTQKVKDTLLTQRMIMSDAPSEQQVLYRACMPIFTDTYTRNDYPLFDDTASALFPNSYTSKNDLDGSYLGQITEGSPLIVDFHSRTDVQVNGNIIMTGNSGAGKTTASNNIAFQQMAQKDVCFFLDPEGERNTLVNKLGGVNIDVTSGKYMINVLQAKPLGTDEENIDGTPKEIDLNGYDIISNHISYTKNWFEVYRPYLKDNVLLDVLDIYLTMLYRKFNIENNRDVLDTPAHQWPIMSDLYTLVEKTNNVLIDATDKKAVLVLLHTLTHGSDAIIFNGHTNMADASYVNFDVRTLLEGDERRSQAVLINILSYVFAQSVIYKRRTNLFIDEMYLFLNPQAILIATKLRNLWKRARKYRLNMIGSTQNFRDMMQLGLKDITATIIANSDKKLFFQPGQGEEQAIKDAFHLSDYEISRMRTFKKGQFLFVEHTTKYMVDSYNKLLPSVLEAIT